ncbi:MAG: TIGR00295 family protein [Candidatus Methanoperedenaceae archaeon]|nr:MAG: TIGR00295 family protein [Candidatus Methanoperedenaceae archaeon]
MAFLVISGCTPDVIEHCKAVAKYAREIAINIRKKGDRINIDIDAVFVGALLHDIGRSKTHGIGHAVAGARIAMDNGLDDKIVKIIERHIGAGIPKVEASSLGLPEKDYLPVTIEEKIVAHADNLISDNKIGTMDELISNLRRKKMDERTIRRFIDLNNEISAMMA